MSEPITTAPPPAAKPARKALGRTQRLLLMIAGVPFGLTLALTVVVIMWRGSALPVLQAWMSHVGDYVPWVAGIVAFGGLGVKGARSIGEGLAAKAAAAVADVVKARKA